MTSTLLEAAAPVVQCKETLQAAAQVNLILVFHRLPDEVVAEVFLGDLIRRAWMPHTAATDLYHKFSCQYDSFIE